MLKNFLYLTPASTGYLTQLILVLLIDLYLFHRIKHQTAHDKTEWLLAFIFLTLTIFIGLLFLDTALSPSLPLFPVFFQNTVLALAFFLLVRFSWFHFGSLNRTRVIIGQILSGVSLLYFLHECYLSIERLYLLAFEGIVSYRPPESDYLLIFTFAIIPTTLLYQTIVLDERPVSWLQKLSKPEGQRARSAQAFALTFLLVIPIAISNILRGFSLISATLYNISLSVGMLVVIWLFANAYLRYTPGYTSFLVKISAASLTAILTVLGVAGWLITFPFYTSYQPALSSKQAFRFTPNELGGYDIGEIPFQMDDNLGEKLSLTSHGEGRSQRVEFTFPFYGKEYNEIYITSVGAIIMGQALYHPNLHYHYGNVPAIFPLLIDLEPAAGGGIYTRQEPGHLLVTWERIPAVHNHSALFTFQAILYANGVFEIVYDEIPATPLFSADASPSSSPWLRGVTPGLRQPVTVLQTFSAPIQSGPQGVIQDFYLEFRRRQHEFVAPLAWLIVISSALLIVGLPVFIRRFFLHPLQTLLKGVEQVQAGQLSTQIPIESDDEFGFVTSAFNEMTRQLNYLVNHLEELVAERTSQLRDSNYRLQLEIHEREAAREIVLQQQRSLAAAEEREQISRDLHDGIGQFLGYINAQAQTVKMLLEQNKAEAAQNNLNLLINLAQQTQTELRQHILGMRHHAIEPQQDFKGTLQNYLNEFGSVWDIETSLNLPANWPHLAHPVEDQVLHIIREALINIRKHAQASQVKISDVRELDGLTLIIEDNGRGFDPLRQPGEEQKHYGLNIMRERAEQFGGLLEIISSPGQGTRVILHIPCPPDVETTETMISLSDLRLLLVDDHPIFLSGFRNLLATRGLNVIDTAANGFEAFEKVEQLRPDIVLMDVNMPLCDGIQATRIIKNEFPETRVILLTVSGEEENLLRAIKYGASGYLNKNMNIDEIISMIYDAVRGEIQIGPSTASELLSELAPEAAELQPAESPQTGQTPPQLNPRQWEVLQLVASGLTYKEVGRKLGLSERTIKYHMTQILQNLQLETRAQGVKYAQQFQKDATQPIKR